MNGTDTFIDELRAVMSGAKIVKRADDYLDSCGRSCRTDNIVTLPAPRRETLLDLVRRGTFSEDVCRTAEFQYVLKKILVGTGPLLISGRVRDYDGVTCADSGDFSLPCVSWILLTASRIVNGEIPAYDWRQGVVHRPGFENHPVDDVPGFTKRCYECSNPWFGIDHPWGCNDRTYVCFVEKRRQKKHE